MMITLDNGAQLLSPTFYGDGWCLVCKDEVTELIVKSKALTVEGFAKAARKVLKDNGIPGVLDLGSWRRSVSGLPPEYRPIDCGKVIVKITGPIKNDVCNSNSGELHGTS